MESESVSSLTRSSEIDNLIIAAAAASGDEDLEGETTSEEKNVENADAQKIGLWRPVILQPDHIQSIRDAARAVCSSRSDKPFEPEPFSRKQGSEIAYQEMADLMSFHGESDNPERVELMRKHSMIFRPSGPNSRSLTLYEQAVNEAAAQIAFHFPAAIYHKRDLAILAKQAVRLTGFEFPNARGGYYPPGSIVPAKGDMEDLNYGESQSVTPTVQPAHAAPASASMLLHKSSSQSKRDAVAQTLSHEECNAIVQTVMDLSSEIPQFTLKSREHCSVNENYVYADAQRLSELPPSRLDDEMDLIRELSTVCGRVSGVPRPLGASLTPYEMGLNEAAAWLVRLQPALLTHSRQLAELARRIIAATGLQLRHTGGTSQSGGSHSYTQSYSSDKWSHRVSTNKHASGHGSDVVQIRLQGDSYTPDSINFGGDMFGSVVMQNGTPYYVDATGGTAATGLLGSIGGINAFEDEVASSGLDSSELVQLLGGSQAIAQLSDVQLEELGRAQFTVVDPRADSEMANCPLSLSVEEDDRPLDEAEILRVSRASCLKRVRVLSLPACGYTSINAVHLARCINLRLLDLSENALRVFPRRLHLPRLRRLSLTGNRFIHLPLIEQFPELTRLTVDEKIKQMLNPQMLAYFCPKLKIINGQCFDEMRTDFTMRIVQEARAIVEPHIRSKWEAEFADHYHSVRNREERMQLIEHMVQHLRERNLLMDEALTKYRDLLFFQFVQQYLQSKLYDAAEAELLTDVNVEGKPSQADLPDYTPEDLLAESAGEDFEAQKPEIAPCPSNNVTIDLEPEDTADEDDEAEKEAENRAATERALFEATDELLGMNLPDPLNLVQAATATGQVQTTLVMDSMGRLHQQQQIVVAPTAASGYHQLAATAASGTNQFHLARSLRQGRSIVMTIVRPRGVSGRPVAEFLPGELRNKDYVKGYMASEIYKKAVKDTLGQKATPKKKPGVNRPKRSDTSGWPSPPGSGLVPLGEVNTDLSGSGKKGSTANGARGSVAGGRHTKANYDLDEDQHGISASTTLPPRPKKRKAMGAHRSLRDLCSESAFGPDAYAATSTGGGPRSDATPIDYDPLHFIRCHAKDNDAGDSETKVWRCLFEPNPLRPEETTHVVATCGGECVCLINCETGKVMKRFKHMEEEFYTIAWTTVEVEAGKCTNILAAAGRMREIRLLHPEQLVCYAEMKGHTEDITAMIFHQTQSTILFSGDSKASVIVWDIGVPSVPDYKTRYQLLMRLRCPRLDVNPVLNLVFLPHYAYLIAGCEDGLFAWKVTDLRLEKREREPDMELKLDVDHEVCIDALAQLSDNALVIKVVESGEIMVFDFASVLERRKGLQRLVPIEMRGHLLWQKTDEIYINVSVRQNLGAVLCGDNEGSIWIYDLDPYLDDLHASSRKKFHVKPIKILEWPECSVQGNRDEDQQLKESITSGFRNPVVNSVEMSSDGYYLAAVTDNNLVCIWRYAPPPQQQQSQPQQAYHTQAAQSMLGTVGQQGSTAVRLLASSSSGSVSTAGATGLTTIASDNLTMDSVLTQADLSHIDLSNTHTFSA